MKTYDVAELAQTLFEEAGDALFLFEPSSEQILDTNPMAQRLSGFSRQEILRMQVTYLFRAEANGGLGRLRQAFRKTGMFHSQEGFLLRHVGDGLWIPVNLSVTRLHTEEDVLGLITARDLREQRAAEAQVRAKETELRRLLAAISDCVWSLLINPAGKPIHFYCSPVFTKITGRTPDSISEKFDPWLTLVHPEDHARMTEVFKQARKGHAMGVQEYRIVHADGTTRWVRDNATSTRQADGFLRLDGILSDITEQKVSQLALEESQRQLQEQFAKLEGILKSTPVAMGLVDRDFRYLAVNERLAGLNGRSVAEHLGRTIHDILPADMAALAEPYLRQVLATGQPVVDIEYKGAAPGQPQEMRDWLAGFFPHTFADGSLQGVFAMIQDVSERARAEEQLRLSEKKYRDLVETSNDLIWAIDADGRWTFINRHGTRRMLGYEPEELLGRHFTDWQTPEQAARDLATFQHTRGGETFTNYESSLLNRQGQPVYLLANSIPIHDSQGNFIGVTGTSTDITQRKLAEEALRESEAKYRCLIENLEQSVFLKDHNLRFVAANRHFWQAAGCQSETELLGKTDFDFYPRHLAEKYRADDLRVLMEGRRLDLQEENLDQGRLRTVRVLKTPVKDGTGKNIGVLGIFWDVTDQLTLEAQLRHAQKMEAIGQLAGGVAHDFNNLLTIILGNLTFALKGLHANPSLRVMLEPAEQAAQRGARLTQQLLGFSRRSPLHLEPTDLNRLLEETANLLRHTIDPRIQIEVNPTANLWPVLADPSQLHQVLMNLCLNARDAMPEGGGLTLETMPFVPSQDYLRLHVEARPGEFVRLRVRDTGHGIPPEIRQHIFEPFFTTKETGKGTGLGLAMVFGIVKQHQGWIECHSTVSQGTCFDIFLPRSQRLPSSAPKPTTAGLQSAGQETVLLVDDEKLLCNLGRATLEQYGYRVLLANNGQEALEVFQRQNQTIDLIILDATMPVMSGRDALVELVRLDPAIHVLFTSGYSTEHHQLTEFQQVKGFLQKPYRPDALVTKVREILDEKKKT